MNTPASIAKHPIHPMLVAVPMGLWIFSLCADLIGAASARGALWQDIAFYAMAGGLIGALLAAVPGLIDFFSLQKPKTRKIARYHLAVNSMVVALFTLNLYLRSAGGAGAFPITLSVLGVALLGLGGWFGGELVYVHGAGVEPPAGGRGAEVREINAKKLRRIG